MVVNFADQDLMVHFPDRRVPANAISSMVELADVSAVVTKVREAALAKVAAERQDALALLEAELAQLRLQEAAACQTHLAVELLQLQQQFDGWRTQTAQRMASAAAQVVKQQLGREAGPNFIDAAVRQILLDRSDSERILLVVAECDQSSVQTLVDSFSQPSNVAVSVEVTADPSMLSGRCLVRTSSQIFDLDLTKWTELLEARFTQLAGGEESDSLSERSDE